MKPQYGLKYEQRQYVCLACQNIELYGTNHTGPIYGNCRKCGNNATLYALGYTPESENRKIAILRYYRYVIGHSYPGKPINNDAENEERDRLAYEKMCATLQEHGIIKSQHFQPLFGKEGITAWKRYDNCEVVIYDPKTFDNQYISSVGRLWPWAEAIYPNKYVREGYWLEIENLC